MFDVLIQTYLVVVVVVVVVVFFFGMTFINCIFPELGVHNVLQSSLVWVGVRIMQLMEPILRNNPSLKPKCHTQTW